MTSTKTRRKRGAPVGYIRPELSHLVVPIDSVHRYPGNARLGDQEEIRGSLLDHGQYQALLVQDSTGYIVVGNNRHDVMEQLGWTHVAVIRLQIDDERALQLVLRDNKSSDKATYDKQALADLLAGVEVWDGTGYVPEDLDTLLADLITEPEGLEDLTDSPDLDDAVPQQHQEPAESAAPAQRRRKRDDDQDDDAGAGGGTEPDPARGLVEMVLRLSPDDQQEALRLVDAARQWLGAGLTAGELALRGLRVLVEIGDARHMREDVFSVGQLRTMAGHQHEEES